MQKKSIVVLLHTYTTIFVSDYHKIFRRTNAVVVTNYLSTTYIWMVLIYSVVFQYLFKKILYTITKSTMTKWVSMRAKAWTFDWLSIRQGALEIITMTPPLVTLNVAYCDGIKNRGGYGYVGQQQRYWNAAWTLIYPFSVVIIYASGCKSETSIQGERQKNK